MTTTGARWAGTAATVLLVLTGCSSGGVADPQDVIDPAQPSVVPVTAEPAGGLVDLGAAGDPVAVVDAVIDDASRTLALLVARPPSVLLLDLDAPTSAPRTVELPSAGAELTTTGRELLVPTSGGVVRIDPLSGARSTMPAAGDVRSVEPLPGGQLALGTAGGTIDVVEADGTLVRTVPGLAGADELAVTGAELVVLDRQQTALIGVEVAEGELGAALRAGEGATQLATDRFERVLVTDTTGGELLIYSTGPVLLQQRSPLPGAPYAVTVDPTTDLAWVTLTARNEVVGLDLAGPEPVERYRFATLSRPESVAVDPTTGAVYVASAAGDGVQVIDPGAP